MIKCYGDGTFLAMLTDTVTEALRYCPPDCTLVLDDLGWNGTILSGSCTMKADVISQRVNDTAEAEVNTAVRKATELMKGIAGGLTAMYGYELGLDVAAEMAVVLVKGRN